MERGERRHALRLIVRDADGVVGDEQGAALHEVALVEPVEGPEATMIVDVAERLGAVRDVDRPRQAGTGPESIGATTVAWTTKKLAQSTVAPVAPFSTLPPMAIASGAASNAAR